MTRLALPLWILLLTVAPCTAAAQEQLEDQLVWDFAEFVRAFSNKDWDTVLRFINADTKASFGGDHGPDGVMNVFAADDTCHATMAAALNQGCRKVGTGSDMHCIAPPQSGQGDVVYMGPRASFRYSETHERWMAVYMICGGD